MKLKKILKVIDQFEDVKIWGRDENIPLYEGMVREVPEELRKLELCDLPLRDAPVEFRRDCCDCGPHYSIAVVEKD